jgi:hypothetical protein
VGCATTEMSSHPSSPNVFRTHSAIVTQRPLIASRAQASAVRREHAGSLREVSSHAGVGGEREAPQ